MVKRVVIFVLYNTYTGTANCRGLGSERSATSYKPLVLYKLRPTLNFALNVPGFTLIGTTYTLHELQLGDPIMVAPENKLQCTVRYSTTVTTYLAYISGGSLTNENI